LSGSPSAFACSSVRPARRRARTVSVVSTSIAWKARRSASVERGPCPGIIFTPAGALEIISETLRASPSTLPPLSRSTKGKRPEKKSSPMWMTFEPVK
jgi:hypothetical protein